MRLVNGVKTGADRQWKDIPSNVFVDIIAEAALNVDQVALMRLFAESGNSSVVRTSGPRVRQRIQAELVGQDAVLTEFARQAEVQVTWAQDAGVCAPGERVSLNDIRDAVATLPRSYAVASGQIALRSA